MPLPWPEIITGAVSLVGGGGLVTFLNRRQEGRKRSAEADVAEASAEKERAGVILGVAEMYAKANEKLNLDINNLYARLRDAEAKLRDSEARENDALNLLRELQDKVKNLEAERPDVLLRARLQASDSWKVFNHARDGFALTIEGRIIKVNEAFEKFLGRTSEDICRLGWRVLCHPDDVERTILAEAEALTQGVELRNRYRHQDGRWVWLHWMATRYAPVAWSCVLLLGFEGEALALPATTGDTKEVVA